MDQGVEALLQVGSCFASFWNRVKSLCVTAYWSFLSFCSHHCGSHVLIDALAHLLPWNTTLLLWNLFYMLPFKIFSWSKPPTPSLPLHCLLLLSQRSNTNAFVSLHIFQNLTLWVSLSRCPMGTGTAQEMGKIENNREKKSPSKDAIQLLKLTTKYDVLKMLLVRLGTKVLQP